MREKTSNLEEAIFLCFGGRMVLIDSVLDSFPTYIMSLFFHAI